MFTATMEKAFVFFVWIFIITFLRVIALSGRKANPDIPAICNTGLTELFVVQDYTYSTYILTFTMMYFILPMVMVSKQSNMNSLNYGVLTFFIAYIVLDLFIKNSLSCIPGFFSSLVLTDILSGLFFGGVVVVLMYSTNLKPYLYVNEINSNKEVCSMPSKQQFRCNVYKNGEIVGSSIN
jgi:hypothetical protein